MSPELYEQLEMLCPALPDSHYEFGATIAFQSGQIGADTTALTAIAAMRPPDAE